MATPPPPQQGAGGPYGPHAPHHPYGPPAPPVPRQAGPQQPGPGWPAQPGAQPYGAYGAHPQPGRYGCTLCGAWPAAPATVRGHQGLIVLMRFLSLRGPFCRDCGLATYRRMSSDTLWQGWWSPLSFFVTPVTLLMNLGPRAAFRRLAPPAGGHRPPLDPGRPMWRRVPVLLFLVPLLLLFLAIPTLVVIGAVVGDDTPHPLTSGQCVRNKGDWTDQKLVVTDCGSPAAEYRVRRPTDATGPCASGDYLARPEYSPDGTLNCLTPLH
ncbi:hypothetical protein ACFVFI_25170 [Streptomyces sp. NPDC057705]|uniref:LppU/SCO3897 family protein n=1 Tax=Streptomyces sp. NPDC057705 TaxID=3346222 RepID=UPI00367A70AA